MHTHIHTRNSKAAWTWEETAPARKCGDDKETRQTPHTKMPQRFWSAGFECPPRQWQLRDNSLCCLAWQHGVGFGGAILIPPKYHVNAALDISCVRGAHIARHASQKTQAGKQSMCKGGGGRARCIFMSREFPDQKAQSCFLL